MRVKIVTLVPMAEDEYQAFLRRAIPDYARDKVRSGAWPEPEAMDRSETEFRELLPQGPRTPDQHLFTVRDAGLNGNVGMLWFALPRDPRGKSAFLYEFWIDPAFRRQGYGLAALRALEDKVRELGGNAVLLHVFGHNAPARALYEKAGYEVTDLVMARAVGPAE